LIRRVATHARNIPQLDTQEAVRTRIVSYLFEAHAKRETANQA